MDAEMLSRALQPISRTRPCGSPLPPDELRTLRELELAAWRDHLAHSGPRVAESDSGWREVASRSSEILGHRCKHVDVAVHRVRSVSVLEGFAGVRSGLTFLAELAATHWDSLHPIEPDARGRLWDFLTANGGGVSAAVPPDLFQIWSSQPLTAPAAGEAPLSFQHFLTYEATNALPPWQEALAATPRAFYQDVHDAMQGALDAYLKLGGVLQQAAMKQPGTLEREQADFRKAVSLIERVVKVTRDALPVAVPSSRTMPVNGASGASHHEVKTSEPDGETTATVLPQTGAAVSLDAARRDWPNGLREVARQASGERSGRELFLLKLDLARLFIEKRRHDLAGVLLDGLNAETTERGLLQWEGRAFVAEMKALLHQCRLREGKEEQARLLQDELCHLAPWLAVNA